MAATILVADDSATMRMIVQATLTGAGWKVLTAGNGQEALEVAKNHPVDLVVSDWNMPVMSGMDFLRALKDSGLPQRPKVVFCTTENGMAYIRAAIEAGADEYVMKPFDRETLESKLQIVGVA